MRESLAAAGVAFRLLTVLPVPVPRPRPETSAPPPAPGRATAWFPLVGALIGLLLYATLRLPLPELPRAALALLLSVLLTGGLHEDGLMDAADAAFAPGDRPKRLEVLRDPRVGAHGVTAGITIALLRFSLFASIQAVGVLAASIVGRWMMALTLGWAPSARRDGLGAAYARGARPAAASVLAGVLILSVAAFRGWARPTAGVLLGLGLGTASAAFLVRRLGGLNGDGHGACGVVAETAALAAFVAGTPG